MTRFLSHIVIISLATITMNVASAFATISDSRSYEREFIFRNGIHDQNRLSCHDNWDPSDAASHQIQTGRSVWNPDQLAFVPDTERNLFHSLIARNAKMFHLSVSANIVKDDATRNMPSRWRQTLDFTITIREQLNDTMQTTVFTNDDNQHPDYTFIYYDGSHGLLPTITIEKKSGSFEIAYIDIEVGSTLRPFGVLPHWNSDDGVWSQVVSFTCSV